MISSLPDGIAVRASNKVDSISNFRYKLSSIQAVAKGKGDVVTSFLLNGDTIGYSLQIPENKLLSGKNSLDVLRGVKNDRFRLFSSTAQLINISSTGKTIEYTFRSSVPVQLYFESGEKVRVFEVIDNQHNKIDFTKSMINKEKITLLEFNANGEFRVRVN